MIRTILRNIMQVLLCFCMVPIVHFTCSADSDDDESDGLTWIEYAGDDVDATIYYVSPTGNDIADGKTETTAFQTIARAIQAVHPGGSIRILPGTYSEALGIEFCGNAAAAITISGYQGIPVLDGKDSEVMSFFLENCKNFIFQDLQIQNYTDSGIGISKCTDMVLHDLIVKENGHDVQMEDWELEGYGIHVEESKNVLIANNDVYRNGPEPQLFPNYLMGTGINTYSNRNVIIRKNTSHHNIGGGILVEDSYDVLVDSNEVYENDLDATVDEWWDGGIWLDGGADVTLRANVFRDNLGPGIEISDEDRQSPMGYILENNISTRNYYGIFIWNFGTNDWPAANIIRRSGNQFSDNSRQNVWILDWY